MSEASEKTEKKNGYSRRDFLKIIGVTSGVAAVGCGQQPVEKIIPYVVPPDEVIPGVATWYTGTCGECDAGCGVIVRVREGRAVKIEGNPNHPINQGGLCARGQSAIQAQYDPDRIREPLRRESGKAFAPATWTDAVDQVANSLKSVPAGKKVVLVSKPLSGSVLPLLKGVGAKVGTFEHIEYDVLGDDAIALGAAQVFGDAVTTHFDFSKADVVVSFGAGFLETWISPVEFSRQWASRRRPESPGGVSHVTQIEPRLSLTAGSADVWLANRPGSETDLLRALLGAVLEGGKGAGFSRSDAQKLVAGVDAAAAEKDAGLPVGTIHQLAQRLLAAKSSLVVAGGTATSGANGVANAALANLINAALGNVGTTVLLRSASEKAYSSYARLTSLIADMKAGNVHALLLYGVNPAYSLPAAAGFSGALAKVGSVVSFSSLLDETTSLANVVLPTSTSIESWSDSAVAGILNINQPAMQPLYQTQGFADSIFAVAAKLDVDLGGAFNFHDYMANQWKSRIGGASFDNQWLKFVELGGDFSGYRATSANASARVPALSFTPPAKAEGLTLITYPLVNFGDGSAANRAWAQEIPDTMTSAVWDSWCEIHPDTAHRLGLSDDSVVEVQTAGGKLQAPVYFSRYIHPDTVAIPMGQGHENYGRYATGIGTNTLRALNAAPEGDLLSWRVGGVTVQAAAWKGTLVKLQGSDSQLGRGIGRVVLTSHPDHFLGAEKVESAHGEGHGERPQMYKAMQHPLYRWGMAIDVSTCTGCAACVTACYAENNVAVVGKQICGEGREMSWLRIERYLDGPQTRPVMGYVPMLCQHCSHAPCEPVCPVYATYHTEEGLNSMVYNRCVGTRYCLNNCNWKVRRFNWFKYTWPEPMTWQLNPDVTVREVGVMEKCSFCIQRIREGSNAAKNDGRPVRDGEIQTACASSCPTKAITFGNLLDKQSEVSKRSNEHRGYKILDDTLNNQPAITYLAKVVNDGSSNHHS